MFIEFTDLKNFLKSEKHRLFLENVMRHGVDKYVLSSEPRKADKSYNDILLPQFSSESPDSIY